MTARHNIRIGNRRLGRDRAAIDATPAPAVGEMLQLARERKGVDLFRAERDTKIRLKYLAALEDSDYAALPPLVYTKGFLRNYAIYLGLDPEDILGRWRDETQLGRKQERPAVAPPPQPLAAPRRGLVVSPGLLVALLFSLVVVAVFAWIGWQLVRFADVPTLSVTNPPSPVSTVNADSIVLTGVSGPRAEITISTPDGQRLIVAADESGKWSQQVQLSKGRNDFSIVSSDAATHRQSDPVSRIINVPLPGVSPGATAAPTPAPIALTVGGPADGQELTGGQLTITGTTSGTRITIQTTYLGPADATPTPTLAPGASPAPTAAPSPAPSPTPKPKPTPTPAPGATYGPTPTPSATSQTFFDLTVDNTGQFSQQLNLGEGRWQITVTASAAGVAPAVEVRTVTIRPQVASGLTIVLTATRGPCWLRIIVDGVVLNASQWGGPTLLKGKSATLTGVNEIYIRAGNAVALDVTVNGQPATLTGTVTNWLFHPGQPPQQTNEKR